MFSIKFNKEVSCCQDQSTDRYRPSGSPKLLFDGSLMFIVVWWFMWPSKITCKRSGRHARSDRYGACRFDASCKWSRWLFFWWIAGTWWNCFLYAGNLCTLGFYVFTCIWLLMDHMLLQVRRKGKWSAIPSTPHFHRCHRWQRPERGESEVWNLDQWIRTKDHKDLINHINLDGSKLSCGNSKKSSLYFRLMQYLSRKFQSSKRRRRMSWIQKTNPLVADDDGSPSGGEGDQGDESQLQSYDALWGVDDLRCLFWGFFSNPLHITWATFQTDLEQCYQRAWRWVGVEAPLKRFQMLMGKGW